MGVDGGTGEESFQLPAGEKGVRQCPFGGILINADGGDSDLSAVALPIKDTVKEYPFSVRENKNVPFVDESTEFAKLILPLASE